MNGNNSSPIPATLPPAHVTSHAWSRRQPVLCHRWKQMLDRIALLDGAG